MNLTAYKSLYDFSEIETALQSYFVASGGMVAPPAENDASREDWTAGDGNVAFFTAFQAAIFQKSRPRVACLLNGIQNATNPGHMIEDNNGALRNTLWRGQLTFDLITGPSYTAHVDLRAKVMALAEMIAPMVRDTTKLIGANQYLTNHLINYVAPQGLDTSIAIGQGYYGSQLTYQLTFSVPPPALAAVVEN